MTTRTRIFRSAGAISALLMTQSAWAQDRPEVTNLDEVLVTAQKVSQSVIDVPLAISVLGSDDLERTQSLNFQDYTKLVPGLQLTQASPGFGRLVIRGINTGGSVKKTLRRGLFLRCWRQYRSKLSGACIADRKAL